MKHHIPYGNLTPHQVGDYVGSEVVTSVEFSQVWDGDDLVPGTIVTTSIPNREMVESKGIQPFTAKTKDGRDIKVLQAFRDDDGQVLLKVEGSDDFVNLRDIKRCPEKDTLILETVIAGKLLN